MRIPRIYTEQSLASDAHVTLEKRPSHHLANVLRLGIDDTITLFNGRGAEYSGVITALGKKAVSVETGEKQQNTCESPLAIHLGVAISRGERMDWTIQKATELGVHRIVPVTSLRSMVKLKGDRAERRRGHWQQVAISACEQCGRNRVPQISDPVSLEDGLAQVEAFALKLTLRADATMRIAQLPESPPEACIAIGPEGGFDDREYQLLEQAGFQGLRLGPRILRTETAGLAAMAALLSRWGDF